MFPTLGGDRLSFPFLMVNSIVEVKDLARGPPLGKQFHLKRTYSSSPEILPSTVIPISQAI